MIITPIRPSDPVFGYSSILKTLWKQGKLPTVVYGFYGDKLTLDNVSLEHLKPASEGGESVLSNFVLSSKVKNRRRGNRPLKDVLSVPEMMKYFEQFKGVRVCGFNGDTYLTSALDTQQALNRYNSMSESEKAKFVNKGWKND